MWILEKPLLDLSFLVLPALVAIGIFFSGIDYGAHLALLGFIVFTWVDSGHVFVTVLRTYMHREEYESNKVYIYAPIVIFVTMSLWLMTGGKFIWDFVVYATLHHNIKQFYGITRWYQKNISSRSAWQTRFLYLLTVGPVILYHFRSGTPSGMYGQNDLFVYPNETILNYGLWVYFCAVACWIVYESVVLWKDKHQFAVALSVFVPALSYGVGFLIGKDLFQILAPIVLAHGVGYWALTSLSVKRTRSEKYKSFKKLILISVVLALICGAINNAIEDHYLVAYKNILATGGYSIAVSLALGFVLTPLLLHFYLDALIWNKNHREAHLVFNSTTK